VKRSHSIVLTVITATVNAAGVQAPSAPPAAPTDCKEARKIAKRDKTPVPQNCLGRLHGGVHGGFGSTAAVMHNGGG
jgi:hypothetical protein